LVEGAAALSASWFCDWIKAVTSSGAGDGGVAWKLLAGYHITPGCMATPQNRGFQQNLMPPWPLSSAITRTRKEWMLKYNEQLIYVMNLCR
jgi:hypothetical protein